MRAAALAVLVRRDLGRARGALATAGFGILAGTGALVFFLALGLAVRAVLLGEVFPLDRIELQPIARDEPGLVSLLLGGGRAPAGVSEDIVKRISATPGVVAVHPKLRFAFPSGAFGGKEIIGKDVGTHEMLADGIDPALVTKDIKGPFPFVDPLEPPGASCKADAECQAPDYCEWAAGSPEGRCSAPIPLLVSPYLVEIFNKGIAPAHALPPIGMALISRAEGISVRLELGVSMMGRAKRGTPRSVRARLVGVSKSAIDLGVTLPLPVVRRLNTEFFGPDAASRYSSVLVRVRHADDVTTVLKVGAAEGLEPKDLRARDVSVLVSGLLALLGLVGGTMLLVAASNIAYTFRVLIQERKTEIGLYRALGATPNDITLWGMSLALVVGALGGGLGVAVARIAAVVIDLLAVSRLPDFPFKPASFFLFPSWLLLAGVSFGALFALLGAASAVRAASKLDPARALLDG